LAQPASAHHRAPIPNTDPTRDAALVIDGAKGTVLYARNDTVERHPASLTKMMTLYVMFERLRAGKLKMGTPLFVSPNAASQPKAKLHLKAGTSITVENAIQAIVILSANDVAVTVAENLGGTETHFTELMNADAQALGMTHTFFHNSSGLPDSLQLTTASDLAILARHIVYDFPQYFHYFSMPSFSFKGHTIDTHDGLLNSYLGADGMKTGYTDQSGYNLVTTASRGGVRLIGVVLGGVSAERRNREMEKLLNDAFARTTQKAPPVTSVTVPSVTPVAAPGKRASAAN
jgi:D-alanyl-D-alanine carboxypeptidase